MAVKGALETRFSISNVKPYLAASPNTVTRSEEGYETLAERTITPNTAGALTGFDATSNLFDLTTADYGTLVDGDPITFSDAGSVQVNSAAVLTTTQYYVVKRPSLKIGLAASLADALAAAPTLVDFTGTLGTTTFQTSDWKPCGELMNLGEFGREYNVVTALNLADGATRKFKGSFNNGSVSMELLFDADDIGQTMLEQAEISRNTYTCRVAFPGGGTAEDFYFEALITTVKRMVGGPDDALKLRVQMEIDHNLIIEGT